MCVIIMPVYALARVVVLVSKGFRRSCIPFRACVNPREIRCPAPCIHDGYSPSSASQIYSITARPVSQSSAALWYRDVGMLEGRLSILSERVLRGWEGGGRGSRIGACEQAEHRAGSTSGSPGGLRNDWAVPE
jgi:hypothetical protein